jgi:hypothetical protein
LISVASGQKGNAWRQVSFSLGTVGGCNEWHVGRAAQNIFDPTMTLQMLRYATELVDELFK